jgi:hypothetical protein
VAKRVASPKDRQRARAAKHAPHADDPCMRWSVAGRRAIRMGDVVWSIVLHRRLPHLKHGWMHWHHHLLANRY